ncbi:MAG: L,D-transpeptidase [Clostridia bacterium]|nr:L,D-transpeptidase [Clostridia bacterium]
MKKMRRNAVVFITVLMMFATTGAGVFAEPLQGTGNVEGTPVVSGEGTPEAIENPDENIDKTESVSEPALNNEPAEDEDTAPDKINLRVTGNKSKYGDKIRIEWDAVSDVEIKNITVNIYGENPDNPGTWDVPVLEEPAKLERTATEYVAEGLIKDTEYRFEVSLFASDEAMVVQEFKQATPAKATIAATSVTAKSTFKGVVIEWKKVSGAQRYYVQRKKAGGSWKTIMKTTRKCKITDNKDMTDSVGYMDKVYYYRVKAGKRTTFEEPIYSTSKRTSKGKGAVRQMYITVQPKMNRTLTSKDKYKKSHTFSRNETIKCYGYNSGCYYFKKKFKVNGKYRVLTYRIARINSRNQKAKYIGNYKNQTKGNYTNEEAELFINRYFAKSATRKTYQQKTKYCIWVNYYTQHLYIFQYVNGTWKIAKQGRKVGGKTWTWKRSSWECSSGKASTPSYTGNNMINHWRFRSQVGIPYWNCYHGKNGIHGKARSYKLGEPHSHGCIRNNNSDAKAIWDMKFIGTPVICY